MREGVILEARELRAAIASERVRVRFFAKVALQDDGCMLWTGAIGSSGYGVFRVSRERIVYAHRLALAIALGVMPADREADHTCHDPRVCGEGWACHHRRCVNVDHLRLVTRVENSPGYLDAESGRGTTNEVPF